MQDKIEPLANSCERVMIVAHGDPSTKELCLILRNTKIKEFTGRADYSKNCNVMIVDYTDGKYRIVDETKLFYTLQE